MSKPKKKLLKITISQEDWHALNNAANAEIENLSYLRSMYPNIEEDDEQNYQDLLRYDNIKVIKVEEV